ncbi:MAG: bacterial Ig-like domain-containing protein [Christensenellaceae bacterium]|jgi:hypothetical protein|nr:bacterial Ig-like domain-containing protein [Christensenellaceae bacterium]
MKKWWLLPISLIIVLLFSCIIFIGCEDVSNDESTIESIYLYSQPQSLYTLGEDFNLKDAQLRVRYSNGAESYVKLTMGMISSYDKDVAGEYILQISYEGFTTNFKIIVVSPVVENVILTKSADFKWQYVENQDFDPTGLDVLVQYEGALSTIVPVTSDMVTGYVKSLIGTQTVKILYYHSNSTVYELDLDIQVKPKSLVSMIIAAFPIKRTYFLGDTKADLTGGTLDLLYDNNFSERVNMSTLPNLTYIFDTTKITETANIQLLYADKQANFDIRVIYEDVTSAEVVYNPSSNQLVNTNLNLVGVTFRVTYTDDSLTNIAITSNNLYVEGQTEGFPNSNHQIHISNYDPLKSGVQEVNVRFYSQNGTLLNSTFKFPVTVIDKTITDIKIYRTSEFLDGTPINEMIVYSRTQFNPYLNWTYVLHYDNGEITEPIPLTYNIITNVTSDSPFLYANAGNVTWQLSYNENDYRSTDTYTFPVTQLEIESIDGLFTVSTDPIGYGEIPYLAVSFGAIPAQINLTSIYALTQYNSGESKYLSLANSLIDPDSINTSDLLCNTANIQLNDDGILKTVAIDIKVMRFISNFSIVSNPLVTEYLVYNPQDTINPDSKYTLDLNGLVLNVTYLDGAGQEHITDFSSGDWTFICDDWLTDELYFRFTTISNETPIYVYNQSDPGNRRVFYVNVTNSIKNIQYAGELKENTTNVLADKVYVGANLNLTDKYISVIYENNTTQLVKITQSMVSFDYAKYTEPTTAPFTISYGDKTSNLYVELISNTIRGIVIVKLPDKTVYALNVGFDDTGIIVAIQHENNTQTILNTGEYSYQGTGTNSKPSGVGGDPTAQVVTVQYRFSTDITYTTTFLIHIVESEPTSIEWEGNETPSIENLEGKNLVLKDHDKLANYKITVNYNDGSKTQISFASIWEVVQVVQFNRNSQITQTAILSYLGCNFSLTVTVKMRELSYISIDPYNITVIENAEIDLSILQLQLTFDDGTIAAAPVSSSNIYYSADYNPDGYNYNNSTLGTNTYKVSYTYNGVTKTCDISITINAKTLVAIALGVTPKTKYLEGEEFTTIADDGMTNGTLILTYDNGKRETLNLSDAKETISSAFYINKIKFDSKEFTGDPRLQTIYVHYVFNGSIFSTNYDIVIRDRKYAVIKYYGLETDTFIYGDFYNESTLEYDMSKAPYATVSYYKDYNSAFMTEVNPNDDLQGFNFTVEYVNVLSYNSYLNDDEKGDKYKQLRLAGSYYIIVTYSGDPNNNAYTTDNTNSRIVTINKKTIYVDMLEKNRVYGGDTSQIVSNQIPDDYIYTIYFYSSFDNSTPTVSPWVYNESYNSSYFAAQNSTGATCYYNGNLIKYITITVSTTINVNTPVGSYFMTISGIESENYEIVYNNTRRFTIERRRLIITPHDTNIIYGTTNSQYTIEYDISSDPDDENTTGLTAYDNLNRPNIGWSGAVNATDATGFTAIDAGDHIITLDTLGAPNYKLELGYDITKAYDQDTNAIAYLHISQRDIYLQVSNATSVFGSGITTTITTTYFADSGFINTNAFYYSDTASNLGKITIKYYYSNDSDNEIPYDLSTFLCGTYIIKPSLTVDSEDKEYSARIYNNYNITFSNGDLEITRKEVIIIIENLTKIFGEPDVNIPFLLKNPNDIVEGVPITGVPGRLAGEDVGLYIINIDALSQNNTNYNIVLENQAYYSIVRKNVYIKFKESQNSYYNSNIITRAYNGHYPKITVDDFEIFDSNDNVYEALTKELVEISLENSNYYAGDYIINVQPWAEAETNHQVNFYYSGNNIYRITTAVLTIDDFILVESGSEVSKNDALLYSLPYIGSDYTLSVQVKTESCIILYDDNDHVITDNLLNPQRDLISVIPGSTKVSYSGTYSITITGVTNPNYVIQNKTIVVNYEIAKKKLIIELIDAVYDPDTDKYVQTRVYDAAPIILYSNTNYYIKDGDKTINNVNVQLQFVGFDQVTPSGVLYDTKTNEIIGYDLEILPFNTVVERDNYVVEFKVPNYSVKVIKREIQVTLYEANLTKKYNNTAPKIERTHMSLSDTSTNMDFSALKFSFIRNSEAYRSNTEVGDYSIVLECDDPNHTVVLDRDYMYTITKVSVTADYRSAMLSMVYDGSSYSATSSLISYRSTINGSITPAVRTLYDNSPSAINTAMAVFNNAFLRASEIKNGAYNLTTDALATIAAIQLNNLLTTVNGLETYLNTLNPYLFNEEAIKASIQTYLTNLKTLIQNAKNAIGLPIYSQNIAVIRSTADSLYNVLDSINSYVIVSVNGGATDVGEYDVTFTTYDFNRDITITVSSTSLPKLKITPSIITITVNGGESIYGEGSLQDLINSITYSAELKSLPLDLNNISKYLTISFELNTNETWPYPANDEYQILPTIIINDSNYSVAPITSKYYKISRREVWVHWLASSEVVYGNSVKKEIFNPVYLENYTQNQATGKGLIESDKNKDITCRTRNFIAYKIVNDKYILVDNFFNASYIASSGTYIIEDSGSTLSVNSNYTVMAIKPFDDADNILNSNYHKVNIVKAQLSLAASAGNELTRTYGEKLSLVYIGFTNGDTADLILGSDFLPKTTQDPDNVVSNLNLEVGSNYGNVIFETPTLPMENYYFANLSNIEYKISVLHAALSIKLVGVNAPNKNVFTAVYGATPVLNTDYEFLFTGFKNSDDTISADISNNITVNFFKTVASKEPLAVGRISLIISSLQNQSQLVLKNYTMEIESTEYVVTPKTIQISLKNSISVLVGTRIEPQKLVVVYFEEEKEQDGLVETVWAVGSVNYLSGAFNEYDIDIKGLLETDSIETVFKTLYTDFDPSYQSGTKLEGYLTSGPGKLIKCGATYNSNLIGTQEATLNGVEFLLPVPNYTIEYVPFELITHAKATSIELNNDNLLLYGNSYDQEDLVFEFVYSNGNKASFKIYENNQSNYLKLESGSIPTTVNVTSELVVKYSKTANISDITNFTSIIIAGKSYDIENIETVNVNFSDSMTYVTAVTLYPTNTTVYADGNLFVDDTTDIKIEYGELVDATNSSASIYLLKSSQSEVSNQNLYTGDFDRYDTTIRIVPEYDKAYAFIMSIYGVNIFSNDDTRILYNLNFFEGGVYLEIIKNTTSMYRTATIKTSVDIFDGFTHNIKVYVNKQSNSLQLILDNVYVLSDGVTNIVWDKEYLITSTTENTASLQITNAKLWIRHYEVANQGYKDSSGAIVMPSTGAKTFYLTSDSYGNQNTMNINLTTLFKAQVSTGSITYKYYVNGSEITAQNIYSYSAYMGRYLVSQAVLMNSVEIDRDSIWIYLTYSSDVIISGGEGLTQVTNANPSPSQPVTLLGYTPNDTDSSKYKNESASRSVFTATHSSDQQRYTKITTEFSISRAKNESDQYRSEVSNNYIILATNSVSSALSTTATSPFVGYYGIGLAISYDTSGNTTTRFHMIFNRSGTFSNYYTTISMTWDPTKVYIVELIINQVSEVVSQASMQLNIYCAGALSNSILVNSEYQFDYMNASASQRVSREDLTYVFGLSNTPDNTNGPRLAGFSLSDTRILLRRIVIGENTGEHDYIIDNQYVQKPIDKLNINATSTSTIELADFNSIKYTGRFNVLSLIFNATEIEEVKDTTFKFNIISLDGNNVITIYYDSGTLSYSFKLSQYSFETNKYIIATGLNLFDGNTHKISIEIRRDDEYTMATSPGRMESAGGSVHYNKLYITIDSTGYGYDTEVSNMILIPYLVDLRHWYGGEEKGTTNVPDTFLSPYMTPQLIIYNLNMNIFNFDASIRAIYMTEGN